MVVDTIKDNICVNKIIGQKSETIVVEGDIIIPDTKPDILSTINARGIPCVYKKEILEGKIRLDGSVNLYIIYLAEAEHSNIRGVNVSLDFTQIMDFERAKTGMTLNERLAIKNIECKVLNGRKLNVKIVLDTNFEVYSNEDINVVREVSGIQNVQILSNNMNIQSLVGTNNTKVYAKDTLNINEVDEILDILNVNFQILNEDVKISYNKILAKADAYFKIMYLTIDDRVSIVEGTVPIMGFIEMPDIDENDITDVMYEIKNVIIKPNNVEEHSLYVEAEMELSCKAYKDRNIDIIQDLYSLDENLEFTSKEVQVILKKESMRNIYSVKEKQSSLDTSTNRILDVEVTPVIINQSVLSGRIIYKGEVELKYIYMNNSSNNVNTKIVKVPFDFTAEMTNVEMQTNIQTNIKIMNQNFTVLPEGNVDVKIDLEFSTTIVKMQSLTIIDEIMMEENRCIDNYSMIIYFVKSGDTLWKIAKKYKSTVEDIARINNIEDADSISVGQQLFIPKYMKKKIIM